MKNISLHLVGAILITFTSVAMAETPSLTSLSATNQAEPVVGINERNIEQAAKSFFPLLDLKAKPLARVNAIYEKGDYGGALAAFRDYFVEKCSHLPVENCRYYAWSHTKPNELLESGELVHGRILGGPPLRVRIGLPGQVNWATETDLGSFISNLPRFYWTNKLIRGYVDSRDPRYVSAFIGYWADFYENHHRQIAEYTKNTDWRAKKYEDPVIGTRMLLFQSDRLHAFRTGMIAASQIARTVSFDGDPEVPVRNASLDAVKQAVDPVKLAIVLTGFVNETLNPVVDGKMGFPGAPNQRVDLSWAVLSYSRVLSEFKDAPRWEALGREKICAYFNGGSVMPDGTDMEQSFNYNWNGVDPIILLLAYYPDEAKRPEWLLVCREKAIYRLRMLAALIKPTGPLPNMGSYTALGDEKGYRRQYERANATFHDPITERIVNMQWGDGSLGASAFNSIAFPYGGYYAFRSGWDKQAQYLFFKASRPGAGHGAEDHLNLQLTAFGKDLLVACGSGYYSPHPLNDYFLESFSCNTVVVDDLSQNGLAYRLDGKEAYKNVLPGRWHTSQSFELAEGDFVHGYGRVNPKNYTSPATIKDVTHHRQVFFLKPVGLWIVVDRLRTAQTHTYAQTWNFNADFAQDRVSCIADKRRVETTAPEGPNVALYNFGAPALEYRKYYGQMEPVVRGWCNTRKLKDAKAVNVHATWQGTGEQLLVTLIEPRRALESAITELKPAGSAGFTATLRSGATIAFQAAPAPVPLNAGNVKATAAILMALRTPENKTCGLALDCEAINGTTKPETADFEFTADSTGAVSPGARIKSPETFRWEAGARGQLLPMYY